MKIFLTVFVLLIALLSGSHSAAQTPKRATKQEQIAFGIEADVPVTLPAELSKPALQALAKDERVHTCLEREGMLPQNLPAGWFVASEIHLNGPKEIDLVVLPRDGCLLGANTGQMWVLRGTQQGYQLVLSTLVLGLEVLPTKTNGFRDIQTGAAVGGYVHTYDYRFDGQKYRVVKRTTILIGEELPRDLAAYETRKPFVQRRGQASAPILAEARAWIWKQWQARKPSYLRVHTFDDDKEETCRYFVGQSSAGDWQVTIEVRRVVWEQDPVSKLRHKVIEYKLSVAEHVERTAIPKDELDYPAALSETEELPASMYRLRFLDYGKRSIADL